jgi:PAS domain S-box-containing protein
MTPDTRELDRQRRRMVIIDDSPDDRAEVRRLLLLGSRYHFEFFEADTGAAGVRAILDALAGPPDCVILDYRLPDIDAPEVLAAVLGPDEAGVCPVLVITGNDASESGRAVLWAGAQDYLGKAWMTPDSLARAVENAMERWAMARALRASEVQLRLALEASNTGIWSHDLTSGIVAWSPECYAIYGVSPGSFDGSIASFYRLVHPDDRGKVRAAGEAAVATSSHYRVELRVIRPDGEVRWLEGVGQASYGASGKPTRLLGTVTDITARKQAEQVIKARTRELQSLADNCPAILARFDRRLRHVFINTAVERATGRPCADFLGKTNRELGMPAELCDQWDAAIRTVFRTGEPLSLEFSFPTPDGERHFESRHVAEPGADGEIELVLAVTQDVTERRRTAAALQSALERAQQAVRSRDELVALVSHDLKNPLNTLLLGMTSLEGDAHEQSKDVLQMMTRQAHRMDKMVDELLDAAQVQSGMPLSFQRKETDLVSVTHALVKEYRLLAPEHRIEERFATEALVGHWDSKRISRVVDNLLCNAIKYSPGGGRVEVELGTVHEEGASWASLRISDEGMGIPTADLARVFQWYSRGENALRSRIEGTGIGLAGARDIVAQHGGSITVTSQEGEGSTFMVKLPIA